METERRQVADFVDLEMRRMKLETDADGNRAKAFLYCLEARCPKTGWTVPLAQSWLISTKQNAIARLIPDHRHKRYDIEIVSDVSDEEAEAAKEGTLRDGRIVHPMNPDKDGVSIEIIRGDHRTDDGRNVNNLRPWEKDEFKPRPDDIFQERLYCIQWIDAEDFAAEKRHARTFFRSVTEADLARERQVEDIVRKNLPAWLSLGAVPDMPIEPGEKTDEPIRTRGWS